MNIPPPETEDTLEAAFERLWSELTPADLGLSDRATRHTRRLLRTAFATGLAFGGRRLAQAYLDGDMPAINDALRDEVAVFMAATVVPR